MEPLAKPAIESVEKGDIITREGVLYPQDILAIKGLSDVQNYLISEVQKVYRLQGVRSTISISRSSSVRCAARSA